MSNHSAIACVVTACGLNQELVNRFMVANRLYENGIELFVTTFKGDNISAPGATVTEIDRTDIFNIGYASNAGIRKATDCCDIVIKTDIDCILSPECLEQIESTEFRKGFCWRYWEVENEESIDKATLNPRTMGTVSLSASDWYNLSGYDERMEGYGFDDFDVCRRARLSGCMVHIQMEPKVYHISHDEKHNRSTINPLNRRANIEVSASEWTNTEASKKWGCLV